MKKFLAFVIALMFTVTILRAQDAPPEAPEGLPPEAPEIEPAARRPPPEGGPHRGGPAGGMRQRALEQFKEQAAELKAMYDANQDGVLDDAERVKLEADLAIAERLEPFLMTGKILKEVDADGNFEISPEEAAKIPEALEKLRPMRGPGARRGAPGGRPQGGPPPRGRNHGGPNGRPGRPAPEPPPEAEAPEN